MSLTQKCLNRDNHSGAQEQQCVACGYHTGPESCSQIVKSSVWIFFVVCSHLPSPPTALQLGLNFKYIRKGNSDRSFRVGLKEQMVRQEDCEFKASLEYVARSYLKIHIYLYVLYIYIYITYTYMHICIYTFIYNNTQIDENLAESFILLL
jgi:hypothetical protein